MKTNKVTIRQRRNASGTISWLAEAGRADGKRQRFFFKTKTEALKFAEQHSSALDEKGNLAMALNPKRLIEAQEAFTLLEPCGITLLDAVRYYLEHAQPIGGKKLVREVAAELTTTKEKAGNKPKYLKELRCKYHRFSKIFGERNISEIKLQELEDWIYSEFTNGLTRRNYIRDLSILFNFAITRKYCADNPAKSVSKPKYCPRPTEILSVAKIVILLGQALNHRDKCDLVPYLTIGLFAGLRSSEIEKLDWKDVSIANRAITVDAEKAKTSQRRSVRMSKNLLAWLRPYKTRRLEGGPIVCECWREHFEKLVKQAGIEKWPRNALRHSFASYYLAQHDDAFKAANQLGHNGTKMLHSNYKELVTEKEAKQFWQIAPPEEGSWYWTMYDKSLSAETLSEKDMEMVKQMAIAVHEQRNK